MPLLPQRFREMFRQAQHDRRKSLSFRARSFHPPCHSERSRGISWKRILSNFPRRGGAVVSFTPRGLGLCRKQATLPRDVSTALRLLNMTKNFCVSAVNRLIRRFLFVGATSGRPLSVGHAPLLSFRAKPGNLVETNAEA